MSFVLGAVSDALATHETRSVVVATACIVAAASAALRVGCARLAAWLGASGHVKNPDRYALSLFSMAGHAALTLLGLVALRNEPCLFSAIRCITDEDGATPPLLALHYGATLGHYLFALFSHVFIDTPRSRSDFIVMLVHHVGTLDVVLVSYSDGFMRIGSLIMLLHDPADVFLDAAKIFKYSRWKHGATLVFAMLVIVWVPTRLVRYWVRNRRLVRNAVSRT